MHRNLLQHGFILILLSLLTGFMIPQAPLPGLALSAHTIGVLSGLLLLILGCIWPLFELGKRQLGVLKASWLFSSYANWAGCVLGAFLGAGRMTPVAAENVTGSDPAEVLVSSILMAVAATSVIAVILSIWGLRPRAVNKAGVDRDIRTQAFGS
jgi:hydroxylaminobenzene mutase